MNETKTVQHKPLQIRHWLLAFLAALAAALLFVPGLGAQTPNPPFPCSPTNLWPPYAASDAYRNSTLIDTFKVQDVSSVACVVAGTCSRQQACEQLGLEWSGSTCRRRIPASPRLDGSLRPAAGGYEMLDARGVWVPFDGSNSGHCLFASMFSRYGRGWSYGPTHGQHDECRSYMAVLLGREPTMQEKLDCDYSLPLFKRAMAANCLEIGGVPDGMLCRPGGVDPPPIDPPPANLCGNGIREPEEQCVCLGGDPTCRKCPQDIPGNCTTPLPPPPTDEIAGDGVCGLKERGDCPPPVCPPMICPSPETIAVPDDIAANVERLQAAGEWRLVGRLCGSRPSLTAQMRAVLAWIQGLQ